jgi:hypothetical protein
MKREDLIVALGDLGYPLVVPDRPRITRQMVMEVLSTLGRSTTDPRLIEGFPVILANCGHRGMKLDVQAFLSRYPLKSQERRNLEKLFLVSSQLLNGEKLEEPEGLGSMVPSLKAKYGDLLSDETVRLGRGMSLSTKRLRNTLRRYTSGLEDSESARERAKLRQRQSFDLHMHLSTLFSPKQKELVLKKLEGASFTKTEQEYYSRVVKKKLEALTNSELRRMATTLTKK